jgi:dTDP-4-dehydrorhamnose reductase
MSVVVLGSGGLLGRHVVEELGSGVRAFARAQCDITSEAEVRACVAGAELVINCAGFTNVDGAEHDPDGAHRVNVDGTRNVAAAVEAAGARLVHVSTDFVFDGAQAEPYDESARANPQSVYATSKWLGEEAARQTLDRLFVVRVQGLYGRGGANFSSKLLPLIRDGKALKLDGERRVQPTWARAAARQIVKLARSDAFGTYHVSCSGETTWAGFAARLAERIGAAPNWKVIKSDELAAPAKRPPNCLFEHRGLARLGFSMPTWQQAQDEYLAEDRAT